MLDVYLFVFIFLLSIVISTTFDFISVYLYIYRVFLSCALALSVVIFGFNFCLVHSGFFLPFIPNSNQLRYNEQCIAFFQCEQCLRWFKHYYYVLDSFCYFFTKIKNNKTENHYRSVKINSLIFSVIVAAVGLIHGCLYAFFYFYIVLYCVAPQIIKYVIIRLNWMILLYC